MPGPLVARGERLSLRTTERDDAEFVQRASTNPEIRFPLGNLTIRNGSQMESWFENYIESDESDNFTVCLEDGDADPGHPADGDVTPVGAAAVMEADWHRPELAYWIAPEFQGEGYGTEAVSLVVDYVFRTYDTPSVGAGVYDYNEASRGLLESLGFTQEGRLRKDRFVDGEYRDAVVYGLLREEWAGRADA
jgi:RimJ/RimL family protein N-acetyltransferase